MISVSSAHQSIQSVRARLRDAGAVRLDVPLSTLSRWRTGGAASLLLAPSSVSAVQDAIALFRQLGVNWSLLGDGSNIFFDDTGVGVPLIQIGRSLSGIQIEGDELIAEAGAWAPQVARVAMTAGLSGLEHIAGIPGSLGGLVVMNGGSLRQSVGANVVSVTTIESNGDLKEWTREACAFGYRKSALQKGDRAVVRVRLRLSRKPPADIRNRMLEILANRRGKFPRKTPNCGSVFVSDPALYSDLGPPGAVIERLGLKGLKIGGARVSEKHANFIVNEGSATSLDILALIDHVRRVVQTHTGHALRAEVRYMDASGEIREAHEWLNDPNWMSSYRQSADLAGGAFA